MTKPRNANKALPWLMALRPKTLTAALVPVMVATALAAAEGFEIKWWVSVCAVLSALFIQFGTNLINDALDFKKGADDARRVGPKRVTQSGLLSLRQVLTGGAVCFAIAALFGVPLVFEGGWPIVGIGLLSLFCGYTYTGGPYPLAYKGLGDLFVIIFFGLVAVLGTFYLHAGTITKSGFIAGLQVGLLATVLIAVNNFRDAPIDKEAGKLTLAVRFGYDFARAEIMLLSFVPFLMGMYWIQNGATMAGSLPLILLPLAALIYQGVKKNNPGPVFNKFLAQSAGLHLFFGILLTVGLALK
jgi:1,4-dihydroxy-2-naphthoate octaprenyltransferase